MIRCYALKHRLLNVGSNFEFKSDSFHLLQLVVSTVITTVRPSYLPLISCDLKPRSMPLVFMIASSSVDKTRRLGHVVFNIIIPVPKTVNKPCFSITKGENWRNF